MPVTARGAGGRGTKKSAEDVFPAKRRRRVAETEAETAPEATVDVAEPEAGVEAGEADADTKVAEPEATDAPSAPETEPTPVPAPTATPRRTSFAVLGLDPRLTRALAKANIVTPTPVQARSIPVALQVPRGAQRPTPPVGAVRVSNTLLCGPPLLNSGFQGRDILCRARTGSGKTAAYALPLLQKILVAKEVRDRATETGAYDEAGREGCSKTISLSKAAGHCACGAAEPLLP